MSQKQPEYYVEYAKSGRATCKACRNAIEKDLVRIGKLERSQHFDGEYYAWHHKDCFFTIYHPTSDEISGLMSLRWEDQQELRKFAPSNFSTNSISLFQPTSFISTSPTPLPSNPIISTPTPTFSSSSLNSDDLIPGTYSIDYAMGRNTCSACNGTIPGGNIRVAKEVKDKENKYSTLSYHLECAKFPSVIRDASDISGFSILKPLDKKKLEQIIEDMNDSLRKAKKATETFYITPEISAKKKEEEDEKSKVDKLWKLKDKLAMKYTKEELQEILRYNNQAYFGSSNELIDRVADCGINGTLPQCPQCNGHLTLLDKTVSCTGYLSSWTKCNYVGDINSLSRGKFTYPSRSDLDDLVEKARHEKEESRYIEKKAALGIVVKPSKHASSVGKADPEKEIFREMEFVIVGCQGNLEDLKTMITNEGGTISNIVTKKVSFVVATYSQVSQDQQLANISKAISFEIPIISELFIHEAVSKHKIPFSDVYELWKFGKAIDANPVRDEKEKKRKLDALLLSDSSSNATPETPPKIQKATSEEEDIQKMISNGHVLTEGDQVYSSTLNMTDISVGSVGRNSFYILQIIESELKNKWSLLTQWGRVGQPGKSKVIQYSNKQKAIEEFINVYYTKTHNAWINRHKFEKKAGKFYPVEMEGEKAESMDQETKPVTSKRGTMLDDRILVLLRLMFDEENLTSEMSKLKIDVNKLPLGKLSKNQIMKGYDLLEEIEEEIKKGTAAYTFYVDATNKFYTLIPHNFGYSQPPVINTKEILQEKFELLETLGEIEVAASIINNQSAEMSKMESNYKGLHNDIVPLKRGGEEWNRIEKYIDSTGGGSYKIIDLFSIDRHGERERFKNFNHIQYRKLLWHGSSVGVFPAILSTGLKIMPHSGGRVGRGIYFADMFEKSAGYCGLSEASHGILLLNEVALGKIHRIDQDDSSIVAPPDGFNSVLAQGMCMPDPSFDFADNKLSISGHPVIIPQAESKSTGLTSSFFHNEYLIYDEGQVHMRYLCMINFNSQE